MAQNVKALIISVGERVEPVIAALNRLRPESLCFFVSEQHQNSINQEIIPKMEQSALQWDQITSSDPDDLLHCCKVLSGKVSKILRRWEVRPSEVVVDYSQGAKSLSTALVLSTVNFASNFYYSKGEAESSPPGNLVNLWDELAVAARIEAARFFNRGAFHSAADCFGIIENRVGGGNKPFYKALVNLSLGFSHWDGFDYRQAWNKLQEAKKALEMAALFGGPPGLNALLAALKNNLLFLEKIAMGSQEIKQELFLDLLGNAQRQAQFGQKYEDAVVRLYRAMEVLAQVALSKKGIRTAAADSSRLPDAIREDFIKKYTSPLDNKIKIGAIGAYQLLKALGDERGKLFDKQWNGLKSLLEARHNSVLGHGFLSIPRERYQQLFDSILKIAECRIEQIPRFPHLDLSAE